MSIGSVRETPGRSVQSGVHTRGSRRACSSPLNGTPVIALIHDLDIRIIHATTGEIIRTLTINPERRYHGTGRPPGGPKGPRKSKQTGP
jgi:hypothetical protein